MRLPFVSPQKLYPPSTLFNLRRTHGERNMTFSQYDSLLVLRLCVAGRKLHHRRHLSPKLILTLEVLFGIPCSGMSRRWLNLAKTGGLKCGWFCP
jgi:hypothetical protein